MNFKLLKEALMKVRKKRIKKRRRVGVFREVSLSYLSMKLLGLYDLKSVLRATTLYLLHKV